MTVRGIVRRTVSAAAALRPRSRRRTGTADSGNSRPNTTPTLVARQEPRRRRARRLPARSPTATCTPALDRGSRRGSSEAVGGGPPLPGRPRTHHLSPESGHHLGRPTTRSTQSHTDPTTSERAARAKNLDRHAYSLGRVAPMQANEICQRSNKSVCDCKYEPAGGTSKLYHNAWFLEASMISDYARGHDHKCPTGQEKSCR
jgi:hypothetical protein